MATIDGPVIVCAQAGNVNTGAFDPLDEIEPIVHERGGWVHVDGAFGIWAAAGPSLPASTPTRRRATTSGRAPRRASASVVTIIGLLLRQRWAWVLAIVSAGA